LVSPPAAGKADQVVAAQLIEMAQRHGIRMVHRPANFGGVMYAGVILNRREFRR
jgi:hypothetical protein